MATVGGFVDECSARKLVQLNNGFYRRTARSFSSTRRNSWPGWKRVAACAQHVLQADECAVLDVACGNLRFEAWLAQAFPRTSFSVDALDSCAQLTGEEALDSGAAAGGRLAVAFREYDVLQALDCGGGAGVSSAFGSGSHQLSVCFGFFHHVPLQRWRLALLDALVDATAPGGYAALSLWCFERDAGLAARARESTREALGEGGALEGLQLDAGDYLLGWQNEAGIWRYCHSFSEHEADELASHVAPKARMAARFAADGRSGDLNEYLVFQRL